MDKVPVTNTTAMPIYVGAAMIPPGETRHFDLHEVPEHLRPAPAEAPVDEAPPADPVAEIRAGTVKEIVAALPTLAAAELAALEAAEIADPKSRKTVIASIAEERLARAEILETLAKPEQEIVDALPFLDDEVLPRLRDAEAADQHREPLLTAIGQEIGRREAGE